MLVRDCVIGFLRQVGVDRIFGNPGSTELPMFKQFPDDMEYVLALQEASAVAMADGFAMAGDRLGVVSLHSAAGVGNAMGNIYTAFKNRAPLLLIAGQQARGILPYGPFLGSDDPELLPQPYVKWSCQPDNAADVPAAVAEAYRIAMTHPRGPVLVSVPVDDWEREADAPVMPTLPDVTTLSVSQLATLVEAFNKAQSPTLVVGPEAARAWSDVITLAEHLGSPVWVSPFSHQVGFPEDHPLFAGFLPAMREGVVQRLQPYDLIVVLGAPVFTYHIDGAGPFIPLHSRLIQITECSRVAAQSAAGESMVADVAASVGALLTDAKLASKISNFVRRPVAAIADNDLTGPVLMQALARCMPEGCVLVEESPSTRAVMHDYLPVVTERGFYTCASGGLGYSLPAAAGVAMALPNRPVLALMGDGSSLYSIQALWNMVQAQLPVVVVIVNNGCYKALSEFSQHFGLTRLVGTELPGIDFIAQAKAYGMAAESIANPDELEGRLLAAFAARKPVLLDIYIT